MSVRELDIKPDCMSHFPDNAGYRWLELHDKGEVYAHSAICKRNTMLEVHATFSRWGPQVRRLVYNDIEWLKSEAKRLGVQSITGIRADSKGVFDPKLYKFAQIFGFTEKSLLQMASLPLD